MILLPTLSVALFSLDIGNILEFLSSYLRRIYWSDF